MLELKGSAPAELPKLTPSSAALQPSQPWAWSGLRVSGIGRRLSGPGGYYNIGNALGLLGGIAFHIAASGDGAALDLSAGTAAAFDYLAGSASAVAITLAMLVFFWSGEVYHRA